MFGTIRLHQKKNYLKKHEKVLNIIVIIITIIIITTIIIMIIIVIIIIIIAIIIITIINDKYVCRVVRNLDLT